MLATDNEVVALSFLCCLSLLSSHLKRDRFRKTLLSGFCQGSNPSSHERGSLWLRLLQLCTVNVSQLSLNKKPKCFKSNLEEHFLLSLPCCSHQGDGECCKKLILQVTDGTFLQADGHLANKPQRTVLCPAVISSELAHDRYITRVITHLSKCSSSKGNHTHTWACIYTHTQCL